MNISSYYLTNNSTLKIHALLQVESRFAPIDGELQSIVSAWMYIFNPPLAPKELYELNYKDNHKLSNADNDTISNVPSELKHTSYKGYHLYDFANLVEHYNDFRGEESGEIKKFIANIFSNYLSSEYLDKLGVANFVSLYEADMVDMEPFFIGLGPSSFLKLHTMYQNKGNESV